MGNIVIVGKSASGKSTVANALSDDFKYTKAVTATTRPMRDGEVDGVDYYFLTNEQFNKKLKNGEFLEWAEYRGWRYGTPKSEIDKSNNMVFVLNPNGLKSFKELEIPHVSFYLNVESGLRILRQLDRGDDKQEIERRYFADEKDFRGIEKEVNFVVNNDTDLDECIDEILFDILYYENPQSLEDFLNKLEYVFDKANETNLEDIQ
jgi:guanylate kinase